MNQDTIIQVMKFMRDTCKSIETCRKCMFRIKNVDGEAGCVECGLAEIPSSWNLNDPRTWKAFKE